MERVLGYVVAQSGRMRENQTSWDNEVAEALLNQCWHLLSEAQEENLEVKSLFFEWPEMSMLAIVHRKTFLVVLMRPGALVSEVEKRARRLIVNAATQYNTAPVFVGTAPEVTAPEPIAITLAVASMPGKTMAPATVTVSAAPALVAPALKWKEAAAQLETILGKVLAHGQVVRLIETQLTEHGVEAESAVDGNVLRKIGAALLDKVKHRALRQALSREFAVLTDSIN